MISRIIMMCVVVLIVAACKENPESGVRYTITSNQSKTFKVSVDAIIPKDDVCSLFYTTDGSINFATHPPIWTNVKGSANVQQIAFTIPNNVVPTQLRIDFGKRQDQQDIYLKWIRMSYNGKLVETPGTFIFSYFQPDVTKTRFNATTGKISGIVKDGVRNTPSLYPKRPLRKQIKYLTE